jgi:hypothetical protein
MLRLPRGVPSTEATVDHSTGPERTLGAVAVSCNGVLADWTVSGQDNEDGIASWAHTSAGTISRR